MDIIGQELERIRLKNKTKRLLPQDVVAAASDPNHPLHTHFEWDDTEAARQFRLRQAREMIVKVKYIHRTDSETEIKVRTYVSLSTDRVSGEKGYRHVEDVLSKPDYRAILLQQAKSELRIWRRKYDSLKELAQLFEVVDAQAAE